VISVKELKKLNKTKAQVTYAFVLLSFLVSSVGHPSMLSTPVTKKYIPMRTVVEERIVGSETINVIP